MLYLPDGVILCPPWHRIFARLGLKDLIVVHRFPVHDGESEGARLISLSHSKSTEMQIKQVYTFGVTMVTCTTELGTP